LGILRAHDGDGLGTTANTVGITTGEMLFSTGTVTTALAQVTETVGPKVTARLLRAWEGKEPRNDLSSPPLWAAVSARLGARLRA